MARFSDFKREEQVALHDAIAHAALPEEQTHILTPLRDELDQLMQDTNLVDKARELLEDLARKASVPVEEMADRVLRGWRPNMREAND